MRIAILGTRGIPNQYGGFEQFAEYLSLGLVERGFEVTVYNPHFHDYKEESYHGVKIVSKFSPESQIGAAANFLYDYICLKDALKNKYDIIYEAGYQSVALSYMILPIQKTTVITNMDGLEWKRSKWSAFVRKLTLHFEKIAVKKSKYIISDNKGIQEYFKQQYNKDSFLIEYGADPVEDRDISPTLEKYKVQKEEYYLLIARLEPENNIELILDGYLVSSKNKPFLVIGNFNSRYGSLLIRKYKNNPVKFIGSLYNKNSLDDLRQGCSIYFHGHSVGGTNPSLLEAMAAGSFIAAHNNPFNKDVLESNALYFKDSEDVRTIMESQSHNNMTRALFLEKNLTKIKKYYAWENIIDRHCELFKSLISNPK